jgi:hypothetical protein
MACGAAPVVALQRRTAQRPRPGLARNVSHCMSLSSYLIDAIVISSFAPNNRMVYSVNCDNDVVGIGGRSRVLASSIWETP